MLQNYYRNCYDRDGGVLVDCTEAVKVYIDIVGHELKTVDDHREELPDQQIATTCLAFVDLRRYVIFETVCDCTNRLFALDLPLVLHEMA